MRWRCSARLGSTVFCAMMAGAARAAEPAPSLEMLEFLGEWSAEETILLEDGAGDLIPVADTGAKEGRKDDR